MSKPKKNHSLNRQLTFIFVVIISSTIFLSWLIGNLFMEKYYIRKKMGVLWEAYERLEAVSKEGGIQSEEFDIELQRICDMYNMNILVMDANSRTVKATINDPVWIRQQLLDNFFSYGAEKREVLEERDDYTIQTVVDTRTRGEYLEIWGMLANGNYFIIRSALDGIRDSVSSATRFLAYTGIVAMIISGFVIWMVSRRFTRPILALAELSKRMTHLDFDAKYQGSDYNEIGILGEHMNQLSNALEFTISELKTANNELKKDIEHKNEIDEMRKEFLSNVSHELKTPIALIQGYAEGLREGVNDNDEESRNFYCDVIIDEAAKMNNMVKKLLTLNQLESGSDVVEMERFDIVLLIRNYLQSAELLARQNGIAVYMEEYPPVPVWGDEFKTEEVFMNYFSNAVNYASGKKEIRISLKRRDRKVRVGVFNSGSPIPEENLPHLWEKFYKVDKARTRAYGGSGVGLSIVKAIMDSMNQKYGVQNFDDGVEFWFELETVQQEEEERES